MPNPHNGFRDVPQVLWYYLSHAPACQDAGHTHTRRSPSAEPVTQYFSSKGEYASAWIERVWSRVLRSLRILTQASRRKGELEHYSPYLDGPVLFKSHMISSPFRALVRILLL